MLAQRLPYLTAIVLSLLLSGLIYWQLHPIILPLLQNQDLSQSMKQQLLTPNDQSTVSNKPEISRNTYNIAKFKLFGDASVPVKKAPVTTEKLPETTLRLTLSGVMAGKDNIQASALIEGPDRQTRSYRVDEEVPGGAILREVHPDRVVLERSGRLENLIFEETRPIGIQQQAQSLEDVPVYAPVNIPRQPAPDLDSFNQQQTEQIKDRLSRLRNRLQTSGQ